MGALCACARERPTKRRFSHPIPWQQPGPGNVREPDICTWLISTAPSTESPKSRDIVKDICSSLSIPVELGGGIRDIATAGAYLECGVTRLIIGTMALTDLPLFRKLCDTFPGRIGVSLDASGGRLKTKGWVEDDGRTVDDVLPGLLDAGASFIVYTDIERDGMQSGVNVGALTHVSDISSVPVVAAGGVATLDDIRRLYPLSVEGRLEGAISGRALYEKTLDLAEANAWLDAQEKA